MRIVADKTAPVHESPLMFILYYVAYLGVLIRMFLSRWDAGAIQPPAYALMAGFLALSVAQPPLSRRVPWITQVILAVQTGIIITLLLTFPRVDFYAMLFICLSILAVRDLRRGMDLLWLGIFCAASSIGLLIAWGGRAFSYMPAYIAGCLVIGLYGRASRKAEEARVRSEGLRAELEAANTRLRAYAERAEEAAAEQERAHIARDLHDAATQTVFSMSLTAEAARIATAESPEKVPGFIDRLQELSRDALREMRALVAELRPGSVGSDGLVPSLERLMALRQRRDGLAVELSVKGKAECPVEAAEAVFRTAREALNNISKHAGVRECRIELVFRENDILLRVTDHGRGFDPEAARRPESYGLLSMRERIGSLGGTLTVRSRPGEGTEVEARIPLKGAS